MTPTDSSLPLSVLTALDEYEVAFLSHLTRDMSRARASYELDTARKYASSARAALLHSLREMSADTARMDYVDAHLSGGDLLSDPPALAITVPQHIVFNSTDSARAILDAARTPQPETRS